MSAMAEGIADFIDTGKFEKVFRAALERQVQAAAEPHIQKAVEAFETDLRRRLATVAIDIASYYDLRRDQNGIVITVRDVRDMKR